MAVEAFQTLDNGTLVDYALDGETITVRAGTSLTPSERPIVLQLNGTDALRVSRVLLEMWGSMRQAPIVADARAAHAAGATHDCGEWMKGDICQVCDRKVD